MAASMSRFGGRFGPGLCRSYYRLCKPPLLKEASSNLVKLHSIHTNASLFGSIKIDMPSLSPTMEKGNIIKWHKKEGDPVSPGDILCEIETDKAVMSMDTEEEGILAKILVAEGSKDVVVGRLIAVMVEEGDDWKTVEVPTDAGTPPAVAGAAKAEVTPTSSSSSPAAATSIQEVEQGHLIGPSVKKLFQEYDLKAASIPRSGPSGVLLKGDVLDYIKSQNLDKIALKPPPDPAPTATSPAAPPTPTAPASAGNNFVDIPLTSMRRTIAKRLTESKSTIPHAYASVDSDVGPVTTLRKNLMADGIKVSVNDFIIKASAMALMRVPKVNAIWANDGPQLASSADISVAVATPNGLITPIVRGALNLTVDHIGEIVKEMAGRAREGKLQLHEFQGGSFSISNLGMFGISEFTAVINPPQVAIMAVGTSRAVAEESGEGLRMTVTLSYDSRAIDELEATRFLEEFRHVMENPQSMLAGTRLDSSAEAFAF